MLAPMKNQTFPPLPDCVCAVTAFITHQSIGNVKKDVSQIVSKVASNGSFGRFQMRVEHLSIVLKRQPLLQRMIHIRPIQVWSRVDYSILLTVSQRQGQRGNIQSAHKYKSLTCGTWTAIRTRKYPC